MKNTIVLGLLSTVALFAIGAIGNSNASVRWRWWRWALKLYCKIGDYDKEDD